MDVVTDLSSYAVSYILVMQDLIRAKAGTATTPFARDEQLWTAFAAIDQDTHRFPGDIEKKLSELIWYSNVTLGLRERNAFFIHACKDLLAWIIENFVPPGPVPPEVEGSLQYTPHQWRMVIGCKLYTNPGSRIRLVTALHYMPIQIVFCLYGKNAGAGFQRLCQVWKPKEDYEPISETDRRQNINWWEQTVIIADKPRTVRRPDAAVQPTLEDKRDLLAVRLLEDDVWIRTQLLVAQNPLPFDTFFHDELDEIAQSRAQRLEPPAIDENPGAVLLPGQLMEEDVPQWERKLQEIRNQQQLQQLQQEDGVAANGGQNGTAAAGDKQREMPPLERARALQLTGLAFSGGGIRSATFNLGVLQQLAERGLLPHIDYLSTVSGGGYIGSWLAAWIRDAGSVQKVSSRLDTRLAANPMADEVRPLRWLRMFSNYLTPNASIMSADAWTVGVTWLRNTSLSLLILILFSGTCLSGVWLLYHGWQAVGRLLPDVQSEWQLFGWGALALWPPCIAIGLGMNTINNLRPLKWNFIGARPWLPLALGAWALCAAFCISAFMYLDKVEAPDYPLLVSTLLPVAAAGFIGIMATAYLGTYHHYWKALRLGWKGHLAIIVSSACSSGVSLLLLAAVWYLCRMVLPLSGVWVRVDEANYRLLFLLTIPLILEVFSIAVVVRMAVMGSLFPDSRREWWAKMGAITHRFGLVWMVVVFAALLFWPLVSAYFAGTSMAGLVAIAGGWSGIVGWAVNLAYRSAAPKANKGGLGIRELFVRFAPYLFILGFVLLNAILFTQLSDAFIRQSADARLLSMLVLTGVLAAATALLSWRVGVNEFSLHHFYRNRLVRAYLGGIRRRTDRSRTVNSFTGFDENDDPPLQEFLPGKGYHGPFPLLNTALNASVVFELDRQDRKAESFVFSPLYCGFDFSATRSASFNKYKVFDYGYRPTGQYAYSNGPSLGTAMAISGAAVSPNMGYHSASATAFLLTIFNVRLGWWMGNPRRTTWQRSDPRFGLTYTIQDLVGKSTINSPYVHLSDGGHFDNMGLYELVRRRCRYIILSDAEEDQQGLCEGLANAIRRCRIDFGVEISIDVQPIIKDRSTHVQTGTIHYPGEQQAWGTLIYIKAMLTGDEPADVHEYAKRNPLFPNQSTSDQFFDEAQFESYRKLGYHSLAGIGWKGSATFKEKKSLQLQDEDKG